MTLWTVLHELWSRNKAYNLDCRGWGIAGCHKKLKSMGMRADSVFFRDLVRKPGGSESFAIVCLAGDIPDDPNWTPAEDWYYSFSSLWDAVKRHLDNDEYKNIWIDFGYREGYKEQTKAELKCIVKGTVPAIDRYSGEVKTWQEWEEEIK